MSQKSNMLVGGESDGCVVPVKCPNKGEQSSAEGMEGRRRRFFLAQIRDKYPYERLARLQAA